MAPLYQSFSIFLTLMPLMADCRLLCISENAVRIEINRLRVFNPRILVNKKKLARTSYANSKHGRTVQRFKFINYWTMPTEKTLVFYTRGRKKFPTKLKHRKLDCPTTSHRSSIEHSKDETKYFQIKSTISWWPQRNNSKLLSKPESHPSAQHAFHVHPIKFRGLDFDWAARGGQSESERKVDSFLRIKRWKSRRGRRRGGRGKEQERLYPLEVSYRGSMIPRGPCGGP